MKKITMLITISLLCLTSAFSDENLMSWNMFREKMWNYTVVLDKKWVPQMNAARSMGMDNFFIPKGFNMNNAPAGIMLYHGTGFQSLQSFIDDDLKDFTKQNSGYLYNKIESSAENDSGLEMIMMKIYSPNSEIVQYICYLSDDTDFCIAIALQLFEENDEYFEDFLTSSKQSQILKWNYNFP